MNSPVSADAFGAAARRRKPAPAAAPAAGGGQRKYTVLFDADTADAFDAALLELRRRLGRRVDKSEVVRELVSLLGEDVSLAEQVADRLRRI